VIPQPPIQPFGLETVTFKAKPKPFTATSTSQHLHALYPGIP
jgi:hypothetical protein